MGHYGPLWADLEVGHLGCGRDKFRLDPGCVYVWSETSSDLALVERVYMEEESEREREREREKERVRVKERPQRTRERTRESERESDVETCRVPPSTII